MLPSLPLTTDDFKTWPWPQIEPYFNDLAACPLDEGNVAGWLADWTRLGKLLSETYQRLYVATTVNTTDTLAQQRFNAFVDDIYPQAQAAEQTLKQKLLASGLEPAGFDIPLKNLRAEADLYREANLPLLSEELKYWIEYDQIIGAQTVVWEGAELTPTQLRPVFMQPDRERRERAWRLAAERQLADRERINDLWVKNMTLRRQLAANAGRPDYRAYRWQQLLRFDYTPEDCKHFHRAIEAVVVPVASRIYEKRRRQLGLQTLRPWDVDVDALGREPLHPFKDVRELEAGVAAMFDRLDPELGAHFAVMRRESLLDLDNRKGKAPGGYCTEFMVAQRPFIFMNSVGVHDDVQTLLHEGGHAFHVFETAHLPYIQHLQIGMEFNEVASMAMELLASPYLPASRGGFYTEADAARARIEHLEGMLLFWPYMAVVDAFQHWAYENHDAASDPFNCDDCWADLWHRFIPGVDWSGLEDSMMTGWQRKQHIPQTPFYYIEYGLAQLGAVQVWRNALRDQAGAVAAYRRALSLGGTVPLPQLYAAAGAKFAFDEETMQTAVEVIEQTIASLEMS